MLRVDATAGDAKRFGFRRRGALHARREGSGRGQSATERDADFLESFDEPDATGFVSEAAQARPNQQQSPDVQAPQPIVPSSGAR